MISNDRTGLRRAYRDAWLKYRTSQPLEPVEAAIAQVLAAHPEYQRLVESEDALEREFTAESGDSNPFLHMGMHLALGEQVSTDRPFGIRAVHHRLLAKRQDWHEVEHAMMECLGEALWRAQQSGTPPNETAYLECLERLVR